VRAARAERTRVDRQPTPSVQDSRVREVLAVEQKRLTVKRAHECEELVQRYDAVLVLRKRLFVHDGVAHGCGKSVTIS
jgi:hypothetical protein